MAVSSALWSRSPTSTFGSRPASGGRFSARTAPARRRCSTPSPAISRRSSGRIRFFGEDVTRFPSHERIRRGLRRTYQISQLFAGLTVIDSIFVACRGVSRSRLSLHASGRDGRARWRRPESIAHARPSRRHPRKAGVDSQPRPAAPARNRSGARPARRASSCSTSPRPDSLPTERRDLVAILNALPPHIGYIIIEHDLDVALRVSSYVTMMHNGRHLQGRRAAGDRGRRGGSGDLSRRRRMDKSRADRAEGEGHPAGPGPAGLLRRSRTPCRASRSRSNAASSPSSGATAWARRRSATRSSA